MLFYFFFNDTATTEIYTLSLHDALPILLPFNNMSGDPEQGYFADGITEDIITDLSKVSGLFVIARNSSFAYKGQAPDIRKVSRDRKSTRLNSSHANISYAVFCLKKKKIQ